MEAAARLGQRPLTLRGFLEALVARYPEQVVRVDRPVDPANFDVTAFLVNLERAGRFPLVHFANPRDLFGEPSRFPLVTNVYADRVRCALALGLPPEAAKLPVSLEYARREARRLPPVVVPPREAPVKTVVRRGEEADLRIFPIVRHHEMDPAPYIDMAVAMRDPDSGAYNLAFLRNMYKGPRRLGLHMSPRHNWQIVRKYEERGEPCPAAIVVSHHPAFFLGVLNVSPFGADDYAVVGSIMDEPLRLVPSETWGEAFLVPADADIVIEGVVPPGVREIEGPFGEFPGTYGPQRLRWVIEVTAITHRADAVYQDIFVGHRDVHILGAIPKEGSLFNRIKGVVPTVTGVHLPTSGCGRFHCYIALDKKVEGEPKQAALVAMGECDFVKNVIVVDADIDPFNEEEVLWAWATRVQADEDLDVIKNVKGSALDPSLADDIRTAKVIIDATRPLDRPFASRIRVPEEALARMALDRAER
ncbi:MAG TPA: UbiD family decarboxylase [Thermodesulfobacteriota bacterium]|nr:UbiD family decarboxylase [Thermodesulfobacteriota bacterium]